MSREINEFRVKAQIETSTEPGGEAGVFRIDAKGPLTAAPFSDPT